MKKRKFKITIMTMMVFMFTMSALPGLCLAAGEDIVLELQESSNDRIYPADFGKELDTIFMETSRHFDQKDSFTFTLSDGVYWYMDEDDFDDLDMEEIELEGISPDHKTLTIEFEVDDCDDLSFEDMIVATDADVPLGDIILTIGGDLSGSLVVGEVIACAEISAEVPVIDAAQPAQEAGDILLEETYKFSMEPVDNLLMNEADGEWYLGLILPEGVGFSACPQVYVNSNQVSVKCYQECFREREEKIFSGASLFEAGGSECYIKFDEIEYFHHQSIDSIRISGIKYDVDSAFSEWEIEVKICGDMVNKMIGAGDDIVPELESDNLNIPIYSIVNASLDKIDRAIHSEMTMGTLKMFINEEPLIMDVAPYIRDDRTYLPIRYAAYALGIDDSGIEWDGSTQTVTISRGATVVQMQVGSTILMVNGEQVTMDTAPEIKNDRVCLPIRFVAEAFGAEVGWDNSTLTVSIDLQQ